VDFFRSDGTDGNVLQTGGHGPGTRAHYAADAGYWQTKGYYQVLDSLDASLTNFSYENCSGGGQIKDYGMLKRSVKIPRPTGKIWDGIEYFDPVSGKGAVFVFRPDSPDATQTFRLKGLKAEAQYWVWCADGSFAPNQTEGRALMDTGLTLGLSRTNSRSGRGPWTGWVR